MNPDALVGENLVAVLDHFFSTPAPAADNRNHSLLLQSYGLCLPVPAGIFLDESKTLRTYNLQPCAELELRKKANSVKNFANEEELYLKFVIADLMETVIMIVNINMTIHEVLVELFEKFPLMVGSGLNSAEIVATTQHGLHLTPHVILKNYLLKNNDVLILRRQV